MRTQRAVVERGIDATEQKEDVSNWRWTPAPLISIPAGLWSASIGMVDPARGKSKGSMKTGMLKLEEEMKMMRFNWPMQDNHLYENPNEVPVEHDGPPADSDDSESD